MATTDQMVGLLVEINGQLKQLNTQAKNRDIQNKVNKERRTSTREELAQLAQQKKFAASVDKSIKSLSGLEKAATETRDTFDKNKFGTTIVSSLKKNLFPIYTQMKAGAKEFNDAIDETVSKQEEYTKGISEATSKYIRNNYANINAVKTTINAYKDYVSVLGKVSNEQRKLSEDEIKILKSSLLQLQSSSKKTGMSLDSMNKEQIATLKKLQLGMELTDNELKNLRDSLENTNKDFQAIHNVAKSNYEEATKYAKQYQETMKSAIADMGNTIKAGVIATMSQVYKDLKAQLANADGTSHYKEAAQMGMSQAEMSQFIGENRGALRVMGGGKASTMVDNGNMIALNKEIQAFGVTGNEAAKMLGTNLTNSVKMGLVPSVTSATDQIRKMYGIMQESNLTLDQLNSLMGDLADSPAFLSLVQANGNTGQMDIIKQLMKLNTNAGYSTGYLKEIFEAGQEKKYEGIEEMVKGMIGVKLQAGNINQALGSNYITKDDQNLLSKVQSAGGIQGLTSQYNAGTAGKDIMGKYKNVGELQADIASVSQKFSEGQVLANNKLTSGGNDLQRGLFQTKSSVFNGFINNKSLTDRDAATGAISKRAGMNGVNITGPNDTLTNWGQIHNSMLPISPQHALAVGQGLEGADKNALTMATMTVAKVAMNAAQVYFGGGSIKALGGMVAGGGMSGGLLKSGAIAAGTGAAAYGGMNYMDSINNSTTTAPAGTVPQDSAGTLSTAFDNYTKKLESLISIQQKQTDILVSTHQEYMDYMKTVENNNKIIATRNSVRGSLAPNN